MRHSPGAHRGNDRESSAPVVTPDVGDPHGRAGGARARPARVGDSEGSAPSADGSRAAAVDAAPRSHDGSSDDNGASAVRADHV